MPDEPDLPFLARELIRSECVMALATAGEGGAWAAPVYYVFFRGAFYFFSNPESRHIQESEGGQAAAAIYPEAASWKEIRGIQMSGRIRGVRPGPKALGAGLAYAAKYPFIREFFGPGEEVDPERIAGRFRARLYRFTPDLVFYLDNRIRFGFRKAVRL